MASKLRNAERGIGVSRDPVRFEHQPGSLINERQALRRQVEFIVSHALGIRIQLLQLNMRGAAHVALARQLSMYLAHVCCGLNYAEVGRIFNRDRTTAAHATALIEERRENGNFDHAVDSLERALKTSLRRLDDNAFCSTNSP
jgi:hypothetical protein